MAPVLTLIRKADIYAPKHLGINDVLLGGGQILVIDKDLAVYEGLPGVKEFDASGLMMFPGLIDQHVHIAGGGGEGGFHYRTPEISLSHITSAGVTTVVGVLGTDGVTRSTRELLAKACSLEAEGITTYIYCGAYQVPTRTITGSPRSDIVLIDKVIGIGEIAISDTRSSHPSEQDIAELASEARVGGLLSGKAGVLHLHVGDDDTHLAVLFDVLKKTELPLSGFTPTHLNRNPDLLKDAIRYGRHGGYVDITSGIRPDEHDHISVKPSRALRVLLDAGVDPSLITMSSDSNGSSPVFDENGRLVGMGIGSIATLWEETRDAILEEGIDIDTAASFVTQNVARVLKLRRKGLVQPGMDADLLLVDAQFQIVAVFANGRLMVDKGVPIVYGTFERSGDVPGAPHPSTPTDSTADADVRTASGPVVGDLHFSDQPRRGSANRRRDYCC